MTEVPNRDDIVPYDLALQLKELCCDEECSYWYKKTQLHVSV